MPINNASIEAAKTSRANLYVLSFTGKTGTELNLQSSWAVRRLQHSSTRLQKPDYVPVVDFWIRADTSRHQFPKNDAVRPLKTSSDYQRNVC
jgi:hypothetical protein